MRQRTTRLIVSVAMVTTMLVAGTPSSASADDDDDGTEIIVWLRDHDDDDEDDDEGDEEHESAPADRATTMARIAAQHDLVVLDTLVGSRGIATYLSPNSRPTEDLGEQVFVRSGWARGVILAPPGAWDRAVNRR